MLYIYVVSFLSAKQQNRDHVHNPTENESSSKMSRNANNREGHQRCLLN